MHIQPLLGRLRRLLGNMKDSDTRVPSNSIFRRRHSKFQYEWFRQVYAVHSVHGIQAIKPYALVLFCGGEVVIGSEIRMQTYSSNQTPSL